MKLSKSKEAYLAANGWSSNLFLDHARFAFKKLEKAAHFDVGRSVIHITVEEIMVKAYVHHNGRTKEYVTLTDKNGVELESFHFTCTPQILLDALKRHLAL